ncbi:MAG: (d)CMP kinase [Desulfobacteraceae bacterium]|jgi:cytidylate kinase
MASDRTHRRLVITIDGPAGAGKTTVSRTLADRLGYRFVDTGALYRAVALAALQAGLRADDDEGLERLCGRLRLAFAPGADGSPRLISDGKDVSDQIRSPQVTLMASAVSARPPVRRGLLRLQRELGRNGGAVFEGRDMGTVVFPGADVKFFLDASPRTRALRRHAEIHAKTGQSLDEIEAAIRQRDANDRNRELAPLRPAEDAIAVDSTDLTIDEVVEQMLGHVLQRNQHASS